MLHEGLYDLPRCIHPVGFASPPWFDSVSATSNTASSYSSSRKIAPRQLREQNACDAFGRGATMYKKQQVLLIWITISIQSHPHH